MKQTRCGHQVVIMAVNQACVCQQHLTPNHVIRADNTAGSDSDIRSADLRPFG